MSKSPAMNWKNVFLSTLMIFAFGSVTPLIYCGDCWANIWDERYSMFFSGLMWVFLWQGNGYLSDMISKRISWLEQPAKRFIWGIIGVIIYSPAAVYFIYLLVLITTNVRIEGIGNIAMVAVGITFVISFFLNAASFLRNWKQTALDAERLKKEQMATQYESLKNQVNPHFLFNSLNALTNLVYEDQDRAADFIRKLSKVYRYVLDTRSQELVSLSEELQFVDSYLILQKARFDDKLNVHIDIKGSEQKMLPPIALQMLLENAIKHNVISDEDPLNIKVSVEKNCLVVRNNLQQKNIPIEESAGMGLPNIVARFEFLTDQKVEIMNGPDEFIVKLPLLTIT